MTIGSRGPSSFIFEPIQKNDFNVSKELKNFREKTEISLSDAALLFDFNYVTLQKMEVGKLKNRTLMRMMEIFLKYPDCLYDQLIKNKGFIHENVAFNVFKFIKKSRKK